MMTMLISTREVPRDLVDGIKRLLQVNKFHYAELLQFNGDWKEICPSNNSALWFQNIYRHDDNQVRKFKGQGY